MTRSSTSNSSFASRFGLSGESIVAGARQALDQLRQPAEQRGAAGPDRTDVRDAVLAALDGQPMSGYQIVRDLQERSQGANAPSAGAVYPTLQLLADEGLATAADEDGRKVYTLTASGRVAAAAARERSAQSETTGMRTHASRTAIPKAGAQLAHAAALVAQSGTPEQVEAAADVLDEARRKLHAILAKN